MRSSESVRRSSGPLSRVGGVARGGVREALFVAAPLPLFRLARSRGDPDGCSYSGALACALVPPILILHTEVLGRPVRLLDDPRVRLDDGPPDGANLFNAHFSSQVIQIRSANVPPARALACLTSSKCSGVVSASVRAWTTSAMSASSSTEGARRISLASSIKFERRA